MKHVSALAIILKMFSCTGAWASALRTSSGSVPISGYGTKLIVRLRTLRSNLSLEETRKIVKRARVLTGSNRPAGQEARAHAPASCAPRGRVAGGWQRRAVPRGCCAAGRRRGAVLSPRQANGGRRLAPRCRRSNEEAVG